MRVRYNYRPADPPKRKLPPRKGKRRADTAPQRLPRIHQVDDPLSLQLAALEGKFESLEDLVLRIGEAARETLDDAKSEAEV